MCRKKWHRVGTQLSLIKKKLTIKEEARRPPNLAEENKQMIRQTLFQGWWWRCADLSWVLPPSPPLSLPLPFKLMYLFMSVLGLLVSHGLLSGWLLLLRSTGSRLRGLPSCGTWAQLPRGMWNLSSQTRDHTHGPCIGRWTLNHWTTGEVPLLFPFEFLQCFPLLKWFYVCGVEKFKQGQFQPQQRTSVEGSLPAHC